MRFGTHLHTIIALICSSPPPSPFSSPYSSPISLPPFLKKTAQFRSYLLSAGISNPVTRETHGSGSTYHKELAKQLAQFLDQPLKVAGGILTLSDVYCLFNRARGMELVSPDDLINACTIFESLSLPLRWDLRVFLRWLFGDVQDTVQVLFVGGKTFPGLAMKMHFFLLLFCQIITTPLNTYIVGVSRCF